MGKIIDILTANPWLNFLYLILAIVGILVSIILYFRGRKEKILVYTTRSFNLIHNSAVRVRGLSIKYEGKKIDNLTVTKIAFWNNGKSTINNSDMAPKDMLSISPNKGVTILDATITYKTSDYNNFRLEKKRRNKIIIDFDYIDFHQGVIIDVYHTGAADKALLLKGTVKGGHELKAGNISKDYLLDKTIGQLIELLRNSLPRFIFIPLIISLLPILILTFMIFAPIDAVYGRLKRLPTEFDLATKESN